MGFLRAMTDLRFYGFASACAIAVATPMFFSARAADAPTTKPPVLAQPTSQIYRIYDLPRDVGLILLPDGTVGWVKINPTIGFSTDQIKFTPN